MSRFDCMFLFIDPAGGVGSNLYDMSNQFLNVKYYFSKSH